MVGDFGFLGVGLSSVCVPSIGLRIVVIYS